jgi:hypothetical protein
VEAVGCSPDDAVGPLGLTFMITFGGVIFMMVLAGAAVDGGSFSMCPLDVVGPDSASLSEPVGASLAPQPVRTEAIAAEVMTPAIANIAELNQIVFIFQVPFEE